MSALIRWTFRMEPELLAWLRTQKNPSKLVRDLVKSEKARLESKEG